MKKNIIPAVVLTLALSISVGAAAQADSLQAPRMMKEVVVTGSRAATDLRQMPLTVSVIEREKLTERAQASIMPTLMEQVPGLMLTSRGMMGYGVSSGGSGGLMLRGLSSGSGQLLVLIDGHPQYNGLFGHPVADSYQTLMAERVEVVRGPASLLYGSNAMGGVVNIVTRQMNEDGVRLSGNIGFGSYGTTQSDLSMQMRKGRWNATAAAHYGQSDNHRENMGFEQYGGYAKIGYQISSHWDIYGDLDLEHFNASNPGTVTEPKIENDQSITRGAASLVLNNRYGIANGSLSLYDNFGRHEINDGYVAGGTPQTDLFESKDVVAGVSAFENLHLWQGGMVTLGFDYQHIYGHAWYEDRVSRAIVTTPKRQMQSTDEKANDLAGYVDVRQEIASWLTVDAGVRYDYHSVAGGEWVPQAGIVARPTHNGELKVTAGKGFRNPTMKDMFLYGTANHDSLHAERLWNYELSWHQQLHEGRFVYGVNLYMTKGDNMIATVAGKNINTGEFDNKGIECEMAWKINNHWRMNTNHSYLHMENAIVASPVYKGYLGVQSQYGRWSLTAGVQPVADLYTAVGAQEKKESFVLLNAMISYRVADGMSLWVRGENLLNQKYEINAGYPMPRATFMAGISIR